MLAALIHEVSSSTQVIVSTQSPLLVDEFSAEDVVVVRRDGAASVFERLAAPDLERWLDEYTLGDLIRKLKADGRTVILISHNMRDVVALADRVVILSGGRKVVDRPLGDLKAEHLTNLIMAGHADAA